MNWSSWVTRIWEQPSTSSRLVRSALTPASWLFALAVARRNARYDAAPAAAGGLPAISIGNLTVGGTGKTPMAAWCVQQLSALGASPAIVLRGVGDDEWRVHELLNPGRPVIVSPDRTAGNAIAQARGADCVVLDDAFQHRRAARVVDIVLVSADRWTGVARLLPAGPFREPLASLRRAHVIVVTIKAASTDQSDALLAAIRAAAPDVPCAVVRLAPHEIRSARVSVDGKTTPSGATGRETATHPATWIDGKGVAAVSAVGDPEAFEAQLRSLGADVRVVRRFPDHHAFSAADATAVARDAADVSSVICTLKDAVKLGPHWPREAPPLWYLSQSVVVDRGAEALNREFVRLLAARAATTPTAG